MPSVRSNLVCIALAVAVSAQAARAQDDPMGVDEMAEAIVSMTSPVWTGPRTPAPDPVGKPFECRQCGSVPLVVPDRAVVIPNDFSERVDPDDAPINGSSIRIS